MPSDNNLLKVVGDSLLSSEDQDFMKRIFYFQNSGKEVSAMWDTAKAGVKKEGGEIIECSDTLEQSKAKTNRSKALWILTMQDWQKHRGADPEC